MPDDMKGMKKLLIDHLYSMIAQDTKSMKELEKEFGLSEDKLERLIKTFLNKWLVSPDMIAMLSEMLGVYPTDQEEGKGRGYYIG
ncbi:MAG: hypothetical protein J4469_04100 [Candidatus Aenigmarchaeota archaeon]|nr:hypothetical protein [Candidatus Aenigmarchaeota archaeon]